MSTMFYIPEPVLNIVPLGRDEQGHKGLSTPWLCISLQGNECRQWDGISIWKMRTISYYKEITAFFLTHSQPTSSSSHIHKFEPAEITTEKYEGARVCQKPVTK